MDIQTIDPATGKALQTYHETPFDEVEKIIDSAHKAFLRWRTTDFTERAEKMQQVSKILLERKDELASLITHEMGKPIQAARKEIEKCAWLCQHFAANAPEYLKPRAISTEMNKSYVTFQPLGVIFAIMPWNFPFWQVFRFAAPNLMAGNTCILKHAPNTTGCGLAIESIIKKAGFTPDAFHKIIIDTSLAEKVIAHPKIAGVTLTGSVGAGKTVAAEAGAHLKKVVLELGGSDPSLILEDADLDHAAKQCVQSRLSNAGQVCIAAKRIIVAEKIYDNFLQKIIDCAKEYQCGDPMQENTLLGPLARADLREKVRLQVQECVTKGAKLVLGGELPSIPGFFYPATILTGITKDMPAYTDEIFGPVIALITAKNEKEAIQIANDSSYGLSAAIFTQDLERGEKIALQLDVGTCCINALVASDPRLPFGGTKASGFGRELGAEGIREFTNVKTICVK